jgi:hypothetical protein
MCWRLMQTRKLCCGAVLARHQQPGIRPIVFDVKRFFGRDNGMVKEGPEIARMQVNKDEYSRLLLAWDRDGSGWEAQNTKESETLIQGRLDSCTWTSRSCAVIFVPELEELLWHCPGSIARHFGMNTEAFNLLADKAAAELGMPVARCRRDHPKELFRAAFLARHKKRPLPDDFREIARLADLSRWEASTSFLRLVQVLRGWFPAE